MKHTHDRQFFATINDITCYWAGFLAADGYIDPKNGAITLGLAEKDSNHIELFKQAINTTSNVRHFKSQLGYPSACLNIYGAYECQEALEKNYNITRAKSLTLQPPNLSSKDEIRAFIRGYMDGDGSIWFSKGGKHWMLSFVGTAAILEWIKYQLKLYIPNIGNPSVLPDRTIFQIIFGCEQVRSILDWLYSGSTLNTRLERKYAKYLEVCDFYEFPRLYTSQYKGIYYNKRDRRWCARIKHNKTLYRLGYFLTENDAALAYNKKATELGLLDRCYAINNP